ncbi:5-hydroxytryptamine receptor 3C-like [Micropterus salmoides]|uniref:5-hydroxytryptamine receptor 3C-like n=1 Tax=Micropterus salmoides TaxID=27706 RepID=UPI0018EACDDF|nr:5-hydroxytryptamine receptor 3C-like [Micropterus salmoides]
MESESMLQMSGGREFRRRGAEQLKALNPMVVKQAGDTDIRMVQGYSSEEILAESRAVLETNGEWELIDIGVSNFTLVFGGESYSEIIYSVSIFIILLQMPLAYVVNLLICSCFLIAVDLFSVLLPPHSVDRSSFKMTLILDYTVFLLIMNELLPSTGDTTPLTIIFFSISLSLMVASLLETVLITSIQSSNSSVVPHWFSVVVLKYLAVAVCLPPKKKSNQITVFFNSSTRDGRPLPGSNTSQEWQMIGRVNDRVLFGLYIVFIIVSFITIISIWIYNNSYEARAA